MVVRGSFRPPTLVNQDMISNCWEQFRNEDAVDPKKAYLLAEITLDNLRNSNKEIDVKDFLDRADLLCALGLTVAITDCEEHEKLLQYLSDYKAPKIGLGIGVRELENLINVKYDNNNNGRLIASFGELFTNIVKMYVYPMIQQGNSEMITAKNLPTPEPVRFLYQHLLESGQIVDVEKFDKELMHIFSKEVFALIQSDSGDWESMVPSKVAKVIKEQFLFGFPSEKMEFKY